MEIDSALLCDAATVREGLLHILGGGITRIARPEYPAYVGMTLALRILVHPTEADRQHQLEVQLLSADGARIVGFQAQFGINDPSVLMPGEQISVPLPITPPPQIQLPAAGTYSFEVLVDGVHQASVPFMAFEAAALPGMQPPMTELEDDEPEGDPDDE